MYTAQIVRARYDPEKRKMLAILLVIALFAFTFLLGWVGWFFRIPGIKSWVFLCIGVCLIFLLFRINSKVISKTIVIGTLEFAGDFLSIITSTTHETIALKEINVIKYKINTLGVRPQKEQPKTLPHSISNSALLSIVYNSGVCNIHVLENVFKDGIKQANHSWNADGNVFDIIRRNKIKTQFERDLDEADCLRN